MSGRRHQTTFKEIRTYTTIINHHPKNCQPISMTVRKACGKAREQIQEGRTGRSSTKDTQVGSAPAGKFRCCRNDDRPILWVVLRPRRRWKRKSALYIAAAAQRAPSRRHKEPLCRATQGVKRKTSQSAFQCCWADSRRRRRRAAHATKIQTTARQQGRSKIKSNRRERIQHRTTRKPAEHNIPAYQISRPREWAR